MHNIHYTKFVVLYLPDQRQEANPEQWFHHPGLCTVVCGAEIVISELPTKKAKVVFWLTQLKK